VRCHQPGKQLITQHLRTLKCCRHTTKWLATTGSVTKTVAQVFVPCPNKSLRGGSAELQMSRSSIYLMLRVLVIKSCRRHELWWPRKADGRRWAVPDYPQGHPGFTEEGTMDRWSNIEGKWTGKSTRVCTGVIRPHTESYKKSLIFEQWRSGQTFGQKVWSVPFSSKPLSLQTVIWNFCRGQWCRRLNSTVT
jgi:hypothetical protein